MKINVASDSGEGLTELAAFDSALSNLGLRDQNLIHLSSVIPSGSKVSLEKVDFNGKYQGDRVYCVYSEKRTNIKGVSVAAGLGWVVSKSEPHWGLFVEHTGHTEEEVTNRIKLSLSSMVEYRNDEAWGDINQEIAISTCVDKPVCAIAIAVYKRETW